MKKKAGMILLFIFQGLGLLFALISGFILMFLIVAAPGQVDFSRASDVVQWLVALLATVTGVAYVGTYTFSLAKTVAGKKVSCISWLPTLHGLVACGTWALWHYVGQLYR